MNPADTAVPTGLRLVVAVILLGAFCLGGCATLDSTAPNGSTATGVKGAISPADKLTRESVDSLRAGRSGEAVTKLNRALSLNPARAELHLLTGLAYHLDYLHGNYLARDLAETGYITASQLDAGLAEAHLQLGRLYLDTKRFSRAQTEFLRVLDIEPNHIDALLSLTVASYYARDLETALGAVRRLNNLLPNDSRVTRAAAIINAAAGLDQEALKARTGLDALGSNPNDLQLVDRRLSQWRALHADSRLTPVKDEQDREQDEPEDDEPEASKNPPATATGRPIAPDWSDCQQRVTDSDGDGDSDSDSDSDYNDYNNEGTGDETKALRALPSPCSGSPLPRMAVIDATIIRSEEILYTSRGVNLLDGLQAVFSWSNLLTRSITDGTFTKTETTTRSIGIPEGGVTYALNIANATDLRNDVLARPTLVALDRKPSMFFSGTNLTIAISGQLSGGDIEEKPIGISLSVTPTFIDDDTLLLAVKAARSDLEDSSPGTFVQTLHTTRSSVTTNVLMRMDQTLVLSGLVEKTSLTGQSKTPLLGDVPGLQYLFKSADTEETQKSILIVLTPRRPADAGSAAEASKAGADKNAQELRERLARDLGLPDTALAAIRMLASNRYAAQFRTGDLKADDWKTQNSMNRLLDGLGSFLYY